MTRLRCPRLCGREPERAALEGVVEQGGIALVTGRPGIGKSRLVTEAARPAERAGRIVATGRATSALGVRPFTPIRNALLQVVRDHPIPTDDEFSAWRAPLAAVLPGLVPDVEQAETQPALVGEAVLQLLERLPSPAVVIVEDLHWADPDTVAVLDYLADAAGGRRTGWLLTAREPAPVVEVLRARHGVQLLPLAPLSSAEVVDMVRACSPDGSSADLGELVERVGSLAEGIPLFVEELVSSPGVPASFTEAVTGRLAALPPDDRAVLVTAAVLGRDVAAELVAAVVGEPPETVGRALRAGVDATLLERAGGGVRYRHALTREAVLESLLPAERRTLAQRALPVVLATRLDGWEGLAAELALGAGESERAAELLARAGTAALAGGSVATAVQSLRRAVELNRGDVDARLALISALSAAGEIDAALHEGGALLATGATPESPIRLLLAEAAVRGDRWSIAAEQLGALADSPDTAGRAAVLAAEVAFATGATELARDRVGAVTGHQPVEPEVLSRAYILRGRIDRLTDLSSAQQSFERALAVADGAHLSLRSLDALHELGTIEMLDHAGTDRLLEARASAERVGAMGTRAVIDLQLTAAYLSRFETDAAEHHARSALELAERLRLHTVATKALCGLAETRVQRRQPAEMDRLLGLALARDPDDPFTEPFAWGQCRGLLAVFEDDWTTALASLERAMRLLDRVPNPEPVEFRAIWPLMLAGVGDDRAPDAVAAAAQSNLTIAFANRGLLGYAKAILAGRAGDRAAADDLALRADAYLVRFPVWAELARLCATPSATADGWGHPDNWLSSAAATFASVGLDALARRCTAHRPPVLTGRETEVLALIRAGLTNKEIAHRLHLSPRTVEKHVETMLRKTGRRSRTQLALWGGT